MEGRSPLREALVITKDHLKKVEANAKENPLYSQEVAEYFMNSQKESNKIENSKAYLVVRYNELEDHIKDNGYYTFCLYFNMVNLYSERK